MSALCQKQTYALRQRLALFDHFVGDGKQRRRYCKAECLCSFQVDGEFEFRRLQHRKIGRLLTLKNAASVYTRLPKGVGNVGTVANESALPHKLMSYVT